MLKLRSLPSCERFRRVLVLSLVGLLLVVVPNSGRVRAQTTSGTLYGVVYEPSGAPLVGARVSAINEINGNTRSTVTGPEGSYRIPFLPPGRYTIRASMAGLIDNQITGFPIPLNSTTNLVPPITLKSPGAPTPTLAPAVQSSNEGSLRAPLVNTNDATRGGNFTKEQVQALPLGGSTDTRSFDELATLVPGVSGAPFVPGVRGPGVGFGIGTSGQFSVNGSRARSNNFTVDGSDNNDPDVGVRRQGFIALIPQSIESIQEFQISTLLWDPELGRNVGSQVNAVSRGGGNVVHGTAFGFFTDKRLNARNAFDITAGPSGDENPYTRFQVGGVIGGPIVKDRTQGFVSYERIGIHAAQEQHFSTPNVDERRFNGFPRFGVLHSPLVSQAINYVTNAGSTPIGSAVLSLYPLPNNPGGPYGRATYTEELPASGNGDIFSAKVTHAITDAHNISVRFNLTNDDRVLPSVNRAIRSTLGSETTTQNLSVIQDSAFGPNVFNQARFSYGHTRLRFPEYPTSPFLFSGSNTSTLQFFNDDGGIGDPVTLRAMTGPIGQVIVEPFSPVGVEVYNFPQSRDSGTYQFADSVSWSLGEHSVKFGGDVRYTRLKSVVDRNYRPLVVYNNGIQLEVRPNRQGIIDSDFLPGAQLASVGLPSSIFQSLTSGPPESTVNLRTWETNLFVIDSWRIRQNFSLELGLRYEFNAAPHDADDQLEGALRMDETPRSGGSGFDRPERTEAFNRSLDWYQRIVGTRDRIYDSDKNNFAPHIGFAWDPWGDGKTSIRAGYQVAFDAILGSVVSQSRNVFPDEIPINVAPSFVPFISLGLPLPSNLTAGPDSDFTLVAPGTINQLGGSPDDFVAIVGEIFRRSVGSGGLAYTLPARDLATPYVQQWHLSIDREFATNYVISVAYVGTKGTKLSRLVTPNNGPNITPVIPVVRSPQGVPFVLFSQRFNDIPPSRPVTPFLGAYQIFENSALSNYHALQIEARKRLGAGFSFTTAYTWSHAIDEVSDLFPIAGAPIIAQDSTNLRLERGSANFDVRHQFAASAIWNLPFCDSSDASSLVRVWCGGWQISSIFHGSTGQPFTITLPFDANFDGNLTDRPGTTNGLVFFDAHGPNRVGVQPGTDFLTFIGDGVVGRNIARGDGFVSLDTAFSKVFAFSDTQNLQFRTEVFNLFNRANFGLPIRVIQNPGFGSAVDTAGPARIIQFALRYSF